ncbi:MAG: substrate-binding domain-containing protein [Candidatus Accumulibacter sp.]|uniref:Substrate-binding domain-containing protein n=1 Tax=Candidatus Accumulibacter proximus TaxID=2954385 RepID=A0A935UHQ6_9PROT|nr:substrate-binding domain-containing protein [Candidatus Accumulibacter proximus]
MLATTALPRSLWSSPLPLRRKSSTDRLRRQSGADHWPGSGSRQEDRQCDGDYQSKGGGAGVQDFLNKTVDFAASDSAMEGEDIAKIAKKACKLTLPMTAGEVVLATTSRKSQGLQAARATVSSTSSWARSPVGTTSGSPPPIPASVFRSADQYGCRPCRDSSGTTAVFIKHLATINAEFNKALGPKGNTVNWPASDNSSSRRRTMG